MTRAYWADTDGDGQPDSWTYQDNTTQSLAQLDSQNLDFDGDGAYNDEELAYGSDPFDYDTDDDGLNDGDEIHIAIQQSGKTYSLSSWDSNGDCVSDFDDFYGCFSVTYPNGQLPYLTGASYSDYDGDGVKNPFDPYPTDPNNNDADHDGIDDSVDPAPGDSSNYSSANTMNWGADALGDADSDAILNFWDQWPYDASNGSSDSDNDGISNLNDPFPTDYSNYSPANGTAWYNDVFGDADGDGTLNYADEWPYDPNNGAAAGNPNDTDGDNIVNALDPAPSDDTNWSSYNSIAWYGQALEDADNDGTSNFFDSLPYDFYNGVADYDGDGWANGDDPYPTDNTNFSSTNQIAWYTAMFEDADNDGTPNWQDAWPYDYYNGNPDADADSIPNDQDPYPTDSSNYSDVNQVYWGSNVLGDDDSDGTPNWQDTTPEPPESNQGNNDADNDGIDDSVDPAPGDPSNYSSYNGIQWNADALNDADADGVANFYDQWPYDRDNGYATNDHDNDGIDDWNDPLPYDATNYSSYNSYSWYSNALGDEDNDGILNFYDYHPYTDDNADSDGDGLVDVIDPAPSDPYNYSSYNGLNWPTGALADSDNDGIQNFYDPTPIAAPPPEDYDHDGLNADQEAALGTSDSNPDSDGDTLSDGAEVNIWGSDPANAHSLSQRRGWGDLYGDADMVDTTDSDYDGIPDRIELHYGLNPQWPKDALLDRDNNGINNINQYLMGMALDADLNTYDSDGDGMTDVFEDAWQFQKNDPSDAVLDADNDGVLNYEEQRLLISPRTPDTLAQGGLGDLEVLMLGVHYPNSYPLTNDDYAPSNGIPDWADALLSSPAAPDFAHFARESATDLDGDGMSDAWEHQYGAWKYPPSGMDPRDARDAIQDPDQDGLSNLTEFRFGSDPLVPNTNNDSVGDAQRLYNTGVTQRSLNGLTTSYQPHGLADYTGTRDDTPLLFTSYRGGEPEDPPPDDPVEESFQVSTKSHYLPLNRVNVSKWVDNTTITVQSDNQLSGTSSTSNNVESGVEINGHYEEQTEVVGSDEFDDFGNLISEAQTITIQVWVVDSVEGGGSGSGSAGGGPGTWTEREARMQVSLNMPDQYKDRHYNFQVTDSTGVSTTTELVIFKGSTVCFPPVVNVRAPAGGWAKIEHIPDPQDDPPEDDGGAPGTVSASDGAGPRYRKISLTGLPLPDAKPQVQDESGEREEESYIDAFNRHLQHAVTDIYASDPSTLLPLSVRRDAASETWTRQSGLRPSERPDQPFGPCWSSNLCSFVRFENATSCQVSTAEVHDEQGAAQRFLAHKGSNLWQHSREEMSNARTLSNTFDGLVLRKKFGTTCTYTMCDLAQNMSRNRIGVVSADLMHYTYARLAEVTDRLGNRLLYEYPNTTTLIPSRIYDPDRPGRQIFVMHQNGRVSSVRGPSGEEVLYDNTDHGLASATRGGSTVHYTYLNRTESKISIMNPDSDADSLDAYYHTELASITDELGRKYSFAYQFDHSVIYVYNFGTSERTPLGMPMQVAKVTLPDGQTVTLKGEKSMTSFSGVEATARASTTATTQVSGPAGDFTYTFSQPYVFLPSMFGPGPDDDTRALNITTTYTQLDIALTVDGTEIYKETYTFNPDAIFALSSATDVSGNTHTFTYGGDGFDDPITETDALGHAKHFTYDATTRVMSSMTDQTGVVTSYQIQPITGLKLAETVTDASGAVKRSSAFQYDHPTFKGFMTQSTVDSPDDNAPATVTHYSLGTGDYGWATLTESTPTTNSAVDGSTTNLTTTTVHDLSGNKRSVIDGRGLITNFDYDEHLRLKRVTHPDGSHKDLSYDAHGNLIRETNENGVATFHSYDQFNRRLKTTVDLNGNGVVDASYAAHLTTTTDSGIAYSGDIVTATTYNMRGQPLTQTDARGKVTTHGYDDAGRLISTNDGGLITTMTYGANSGGSVFDSSGFKPTQVTDPRGTITDLVYDKMYRTLSKTVTYSNQLPAQLPLQIMLDTAQQDYQEAQTQEWEDRGEIGLAAEILRHAQLRCDPVAAAAALAKANEALIAPSNDLRDKTAAKEQADLAVQNATLAYASAQTAAYNDAATAAALAAWDSAQANVETALSAQSGAADIIQAAKDSDDTARQNAAALGSAAEEAALQVANCTSDIETATTNQLSAQASVDYLSSALDLAIDASTRSSLGAQLEAANATLTAATAALTAATSAKATADIALSAAQTASSEAGTTLSDADATLTAVLTQNDPAKLQIAVDNAESAESTAKATYEYAQQQAQIPVKAAKDTLDAKALLFNAASAEESAAQLPVAAALYNQSAAEEDLRIATDAAGNPVDLEAFETYAADAQRAYDSAVAALDAQLIIEEAARQLSTRLQQEWEFVQPHLGDTLDHTATTSTEYDAAGRPTQVTDALGRITLTSYDVFGQIQQVTHPDDTIVSTAYTHHGKPWLVTDELGRQTVTTYDEAGRAVQVSAPTLDDSSRPTTTTEYDAASNPVRITDPLGRVTESEYDERNRAVAVYAPPVWDGETGVFVRPVTQTSYDALGQVLTVTDPLGSVTTHLYDNAGRCWKLIAPAVDGASPTTVTLFDPGGMSMEVTNPLGITTYNSYDIHGRLIRSIFYDEVNLFAYDELGNRISVSDGKSQTTNFGYDGLNRLTWQTFANGDTWTYAYDSVHKLSQTSPSGITTRYTYDDRDRLLTTSAPGISRTYSYDPAGHLRSVTEAGNDAATVAYTYDALSRVITETSLGITHSYGYDLAGNRTSASYGTGRYVQTSYDAHNRPEMISEGGRVTRYGYDLAGRAVALVAGNGQTSSNTYDALGRLVDRTLFRTTGMSQSEVLAEFSWQHDLLGNVTQQLETWPGDATRAAGIRNTVMTYDHKDRLSTETITEPGGAVTATTYVYDKANNRLQKMVTGGSDPGVWSYTYNAANQLTDWTQSSSDGTLLKSARLGYDADGNRTSQTITGTVGTGINPPPAASGTTNYAWDSQGRLSSVTMPDGITQYAYDYDYRTRRIGTHKMVSSVEQTQTAIVFAGGLSLAEYENNAGAMPSTPTVEYTRGPDMGGGVGGMLYSLRGGAAGPSASVVKYSLSNGRGDIVAQSDSSAALTWTASYEAYGRRTQETGSNVDKQRANTKDEDPTGLLNEGFRYRDLETGVWLSRDPAGFVDGPNVYAYVKQNPWTGWDPHGLAEKKPGFFKRVGNFFRKIFKAKDKSTSGGSITNSAHISQDTSDLETRTITNETYKVNELNVDLDGHPQCYHPDGKPPGLEPLANAHVGADMNRPVVGYVTDKKGNGVVQTDSDPAPGYYVSKTSLQDKTRAVSDPSRYVHPGEINYLVTGNSRKLGEIATVAWTRQQNGETVTTIQHAIVGDGGNSSGAEGSLALVRNLGYTQASGNNGIESGSIRVVTYRGSGDGKPLSQGEINRRGEFFFRNYGGVNQLNTDQP